MRDDRQRLLDILEAIERIERYSSRGRDAFFGDELIQTWVVHHLQIIGEATRRLTDEFRAAHPDAPWSKIVGMRNLMVHAYFGIDRDIVWQVVDRDLPVLRERIAAIVEEPDETRSP